jgi:hypothetical protein
MRNSLFYSKHCPHCVELIRVLGSGSSIADNLLYVCVDEPSVRNVAFVVKIDRVPTIVYENKQYVGEAAFEFVSKGEVRAETIHDDSGPFKQISLEQDRPEVISESKVSDFDLEAMLKQRQADIVTPPVPQ